MTVADWKRPERMPQEQWDQFLAAVRGEMKLLLGEITAELYVDHAHVRADLIRERRPVLCIGASIGGPMNGSVWVKRPRR